MFFNTLYKKMIIILTYVVPTVLRRKKHIAYGYRAWQSLIQRSGSIIQFSNYIYKKLFLKSVAEAFLCLF